MASGDMILNESASSITGSNFSPRCGSGMNAGGADANITIIGRMMHHPLFNGSAPCHCVSSGCLAAAPPGHLDTAGGRICWKCSR